MSNSEIRTEPVAYTRFGGWMRQSAYYTSFNDPHDHRNLADATKLYGFRSLTFRSF